MIALTSNTFKDDLHTEQKKNKTFTATSLIVGIDSGALAREARAAEHHG